MFAGARSAATAAIRESKRTQRCAVVLMRDRKAVNLTGGRRAADFTERGHKSLLRVEFWDLLTEKSRALRFTQGELKPVVYNNEARNAGKMSFGRPQGKPAVQNRNAPAGAG